MGIGNACIGYHFSGCAFNERDATPRGSNQNSMPVFNCLALIRRVESRLHVVGQLFSVFRPPTPGLPAKTAPFATHIQDKYFIPTANDEFVHVSFH